MRMMLKLLELTWSTDSNIFYYLFCYACSQYNLWKSLSADFLNMWKNQFFIQLNFCNTDTKRTERSVRLREVSIWKRSLWWRHFYDSTYSFKCSVAKTRLTRVFKLHLKLLIHCAKTLSFSSIQYCTSRLQTNYCFKTKQATAQCCM